MSCYGLVENQISSVTGKLASKCYGWLQTDRRLKGSEP